VYASDPTLVSNLSGLKPIFGDHCLVHFEYTAGKPVFNTTIKRNWIHYNKEQLIVNLRCIDWTIKSEDVQGCWNEIENKLIKVVDSIALLQELKKTPVSKLNLPYMK
jgi:hypothetical protein